MKIVHRPKRNKQASTIREPLIPAWFFPQGTVVEKKGYYFEASIYGVLGSQTRWKYLPGWRPE